MRSKLEVCAREAGNYQDSIDREYPVTRPMRPAATLRLARLPTLHTGPPGLAGEQTVSRRAPEELVLYFWLSSYSRETKRGGPKVELRCVMDPQAKIAFTSVRGGGRRLGPE